VLHHTGHALQFARQCRRIGNLSEVAVQNVIALVGDERLAQRGSADRDRRT